MSTTLPSPRPARAQLHPRHPPDAVPADLTSAATVLADATLHVPIGPWTPELLVGAPAPFAAVLVEGLLLREIELHDVPAAQLVGADDVIDPFTAPPSLLSGERLTWRAVEPSSIAVLGARFVAATRRWPALSYALQRRHAEQAHRSARCAAVSQLPRVEERLLALFRVLAEDRGRVCADGIRVPLPVTHECLGRLIGARRPTVSLALRSLAVDGLLRREHGDWLLSPGATRLLQARAIEAAA